MNSPEINPYQPVVLDDPALDASVAEFAITLPLSAKLRRVATNQYLLRWHPRRLFFGSLVIVGVSTMWIHYSVRAGRLVFLITLPTVMLLSTLIYEAMVRRTRRQIHEKSESMGLIEDQHVTLRCEPDRLVMTSDRGREHRWAYSDVKLFRTSKGVLISPEPLLFFLLPKKMDQAKTFIKALRKSVG